MTKRLSVVEKNKRKAVRFVQKTVKKVINLLNRNV